MSMFFGGGGKCGKGGELGFGGGGDWFINFVEEVRCWYFNYVLLVIISCALFDVCDGFKLV